MTPIYTKKYTATPLLGVLCCLFVFMFSKAQTTYYSKATGNLTATGTWGTNTDGTGTAPANFTTANRIYVITNRSTVTLNANWTVSGASSKVQLGNGSSSIGFTIPTTAALSGIIDVSNSATLTIQHTTIPTLGTLSSGSTVDYARAGNQTVRNATYYNLIISGSGIKSLSNTTNTSITNNLTLNTGLSFKLNTSTTLTCTITGSLTGNGGIVGGGNSNLSISGSGDLGTLTFSTTLSLYAFSVNRTPSGSLTLGSNLTVSNAFTHTNGSINLGGKLLTLNNVITFPAASSNGYFSGSSTSSLSIGGTGAMTNNMYMDQSSSATKSLGSLALNRTGQTLVLGSDAIVGSRFTQTAGIISLNGKLLTLDGIITFPTTATNGSFVGSSTSSLSIGGSGAMTNSLFMSQTSSATRTLHSLTFNRSGQTLRLGNNLISSGAFNHTNGTLTVGTTSLVLSGNITFPASVSNGAITGATTSSITIDGSGTIANSMYMTQTTTTTRTLRFFELNRSDQTVTLGNALIVSGNYTQTNGNLGLGSNLLTLNGVITFPAAATNGVLTGSSTSSISITGTGAISNSLYMNQTSSATKSMSSITLNRTGQTLTLGNGLSLIDVITPTNGTLASAGNLTLTATSASVVARIGTIGASASVTGNVTVESYAKGGNTGWALLSSAGVTGRTFADWNDDFVITCASCPNGSTAGGSPFTSITTYNELAGGVFGAAARYVNINSISDAITVGKGYWVYLGNSATTSSDIKFEVTGPVNQGNYLINLSYTSSGGGTASDWGYNLIANPYPSPISWTSLRNGNAAVADAIYAYNADVGDYVSYVAGISSPAVGSGGIGNMIPAGQGFYVKANSATSLTAREVNKSASTQVLLKSMQFESVPSNPQLIRIKANGAGMHHETVVYFNPNTHPYYESDYDAPVFGMTPGALNISSVMNDTSYTINGVGALSSGVQIPLKVVTGTSASYQIYAEDFESLPSGACLILHDNVTNANHDLRTGPYTCSINHTETTSRFSLNIAVNYDITVASHVIEPSCHRLNDGSIIASSTTAGTYDYYWKNDDNQVIRHRSGLTTADTLKDVANGYYQVDITRSGVCSNGSQNFHVAAQGGTSALYTTPNTVAVLRNDSAEVSFTNASINADIYHWTFGDGNESEEVSPIHVYTSVGEYPVTLLALNSACGDTVEYTSIVNVTSIASGIQESALNSSNSMVINRDEYGYFTQFSYAKPTNAIISISNLLGEAVCKDIVVSQATYGKVYIPIPVVEHKLLIITTTSDKGERVYRKIIAD